MCTNKFVVNVSIVQRLDNLIWDVKYEFCSHDRIRPFVMYLQLWMTAEHYIIATMLSESAERIYSEICIGIVSYINVVPQRSRTNGHVSMHGHCTVIQTACVVILILLPITTELHPTSIMLITCSPDRR